MIKWNEVIARLHLVALTSKHVGPAFTLARFTWAAKTEEKWIYNRSWLCWHSVKSDLPLWNFKWHRRRSTSEHSRHEMLLGSAAGPSALLKREHSPGYRLGSTQLSLSKTASRLRLEASMDQRPLPVGSLQAVSSLWMVRGFHAMDAVVLWGMRVQGASLATRHSQEAHLPCKPRAAFGSKLASHTDSISICMVSGRARACMTLHAPGCWAALTCCKASRQVTTSSYTWGKLSPAALE